MRDIRMHTLKEGLLAELLSDVDRLFERGEALEAGLSQQLREVSWKIEEASRAATASFAHGASTERERWTREARALTKELTSLGHLLTARGQRALWIAVLAGLLNGMIGGLLVAIAVV